MSDDRLRGAAEKVSNTANTSRDTKRTVDDRPARTVSLTNEERIALARSSISTEILPKPPEIPGFKMIWLSTNNQADSLYNRERMGYVKVRPEEVPGFCHDFLKSSSDIGEVRCNEMILFKIEEALWYEYMKINHHEKPLQDETGIVEDAQNRLVDVKTGKSLLTDVDEGMKAQKVPVPKSFEG